MPVCLAYDQSHYEPLVPCSSEDIAKTICLATQVLDGSYNLRMKDIPLFEINDQEIISVQSHYDKEYPSLPTKALNKTIVKKSIQNKQLFNIGSYDKDFPPLPVKGLARKCHQNKYTQKTRPKDNSILENLEHLESAAKKW